MAEKNNAKSKKKECKIDNFFTDISVKDPKEDLTTTKLIWEIEQIFMRNYDNGAYIIGEEQKNISKSIRQKLESSSFHGFIHFLSSMGHDFDIVLRKKPTFLDNISDPLETPSLPPKQKLLLITGCARSGSHYIAKVLINSGLYAFHEEEGPDGIVSWMHAVDSPFAPYGPPSRDFEYKHIFHQVRHPLNSISSITTENYYAWRFICKYVPEIDINEPFLIRSAKYWYYWNLLAEKKAELSYRIEDIENAFDQICAIINKKLNRSALQSIPNDFQSRHHRKYTWQDLKNVLDSSLFKKIRNLASHYGYGLDD